MASNRASRFEFGKKEYTHRGRTVVTTYGSKDFSTFIQRSITELEVEVGFVPTGYEHRPDRISEVFYGTPGYWWLLCWVNNINDPFEGFRAGQRILIPKLS